MKLTIDRAKWWRGNGDDESQLLREDGTMCCLGFLGKACGYTDEQLLKVTTPSRAVEGFHEGIETHQAQAQPNLWPKGMIDVYAGGRCLNTDLTDTMMMTNDHEAKKLGAPASEEDRERRIAESMAKIGVEVEFVGEGHPRPSKPGDTEEVPA